MDDILTPEMWANIYAELDELQWYQEESTTTVEEENTICLRWE